MGTSDCAWRAGSAESDAFLDESNGAVVPTVYQTDGVWIWSAAIYYYLRTHGLGPDPEFLEYLRYKNYVYVEPSEEQVRAAGTALKDEIRRSQAE